MEKRDLLVKGKAKSMYATDDPRYVVMHFRDERSRDAYLSHPEHEKVKEKVFGALDGGLDGVIAFDFAP